MERLPLTLVGFGSGPRLQSCTPYCCCCCCFQRKLLLRSKIVLLVKGLQDQVLGKYLEKVWLNTSVSSCAMKSQIQKGRCPVQEGTMKFKGVWGFLLEAKKKVTYQVSDKFPFTDQNFINCLFSFLSDRIFMLPLARSSRFVHGYMEIHFVLAQWLIKTHTEWRRSKKMYN